MLNSASDTLVKGKEPIIQPTNPGKDLPLHQGGHAKIHVPSFITSHPMEVFFFYMRNQ